MKKIIILLLFIAYFFNCDKEKKLDDYPISEVSIQHVKLNDKFWLPKIQQLQNETIKHAFLKCEEEGRFHNFLVAAGKKEGQYCGKMPFDDTDVYKIIEGVSYSLVTNPNPKLENYIDSVIALIADGQENDGYLTTWKTINPDTTPAQWVKPGPRWYDLGASHELYNAGHLYEAAFAHYQATGKKIFLNIALKNADLMCETFGPGKLQTPPGHQIIETGLIKLYRATGEEKYLDLARFFLDARGDSTGHQLYGNYSQDHLPVTRQDEAVGHAVRAVYMYAAMTDIAAIQQDADYIRACHKIWNNVVSQKMYITGGIGSSRDGEAFGKNYELPNLSAYNETCAAIGNVFWNHRLFMMTGNAKYFDVIERTLYNGLISGISLDGKNFFYPNPLESNGEYKFNMGAASRQPWFSCSCCPTNLVRFVPSIPGLIYAVDQRNVYVNLFMANEAEVMLNNHKIGIRQHTEYPWENKISIIISPEKSKEFTLKIRIPGWSGNNVLPSDLYSYLNKNKQSIEVKVNGETKELILDKGYIAIAKKWQKGDGVEIRLPMKIRQVVAHENVKEDSGKVAIEYGPFVYCAEGIDNPKLDEIEISDDIDFDIEKEKVINEAVLALKRNEIKLIPYYAWSNRGVGKMKVWFHKQ